MMFCKETGRKFVLWTRENTRLSKPLVDAMSKQPSEHRTFDPEAVEGAVEGGGGQ
jgi:hypothetical protein